MRVLITGGAGFIGSHLADSLLRERHQVAVLGAAREESVLLLGGDVTHAVEDDEGNPDLAKAQLMVWTFVSLGVYIVATVDAVARTLAATNGSAAGIACGRDRASWRRSVWGVAFPGEILCSMRCPVPSPNAKSEPE